MEKQKGIGVFLVILGIVLLLGQLGWFGDHLFLYFLALGFFGVYLYLGGAKHYGNVGFLIPSMVLLAISIFADVERVIGERNVSGGFFFIFLAAAFLTVYLIHTRRAGEDSAGRKWPLYPAVGLLAFGVFIILVETFETWSSGWIGNYIASLALIAVGLYIILRRTPRAK